MADARAVDVDDIVAVTAIRNSIGIATRQNDVVPAVTVYFFQILAVASVNQIIAVAALKSVRVVASDERVVATHAEGDAGVSVR